MKIAFVYDVIYPFVKGGAEKRNYEIAKRLSKNKDLDVHLFGMNYWGGGDTLKKNGLSYHGVSRARELYSPNGKRRFLPPIIFALKLIPNLFKEDIDVIDCSAFPYFPVFVCSAYGLLKRKKVYVTWHEYWGDYWYEYLGVLGIFGKIIERLAIWASPNIIAVSKRTKRDLIKAGVKESKISVVENGVSIETVINAPKSSETSDVMFIGRLLKHKNPELLVKAMLNVRAKIPGVKCILVGTGPEEQHLRELVFQYSLENNVIIIGNGLPTEELYGLLKASKIFVFPSEREGFGITVIEAKAAGLPVITLDAEHNAAVDLIKNNNDGLLCNKDPVDLAEKILFLLNNPKKRAAFSKASSHSSVMHTWDNCVDKLSRVISKGVGL